MERVSHLFQVIDQVFGTELLVPKFTRAEVRLPETIHHNDLVKYIVIHHAKYENVQ